MKITIESFESISRNKFHEEPEEVIFRKHREYVHMRFDELVREIGLIKEKLGITIESIEPVIGFHEDPEEAMLDEHRTYVATEFDEHREYVDMRFDKLVREIGLIKEHLGT